MTQSFADRVKAAAAAAAQKTASDAQTSRGLLFGSGVTQKLGAKVAREFDAAQDQKHFMAIPTADELDALTVSRIPSTLTAANIVLDETQQAAVDGLANQQFGCIIGKAGTGKTTTIKALIARIMAENPGIAMEDIIFCSFTGRAVQQIKRTLPQEWHARCDTIHGVLEYAPEMVEIDTDDGVEIRKLFIPHRTKLLPLTAKIIVTDEGGMTPIDLWNNLMDATPSNCRVYILGDIYQLPPVHGRSILGFAMLHWPTYELGSIHRTSENSLIDGAWDIMNGKWPSAVEGKVIMHKIDDGSSRAYMEIIAAVQHMTKLDVFHGLRDGIITPTNKHQLGQETLNERLCSFFNPPREVQGITVNPRTIVTCGFTHKSLAVGDKVMATENDRDAGITNGMVGVIESIVPNAAFKGESIDTLATAHSLDTFELDLSGMHDMLTQIEQDEVESAADKRSRQASHVVTVRFQNMQEPMSFSSAGAINSLNHAYAFTCHKAQGGEYPVVVIVLHSANLSMLTREWLYTAWTRAQEKVILLYNSRGLTQALNRQIIKGQTLHEKAKEFIAVQDAALKGAEVTLPNLPQRCTV